jgi:hypothetical protein
MAIPISRLCRVSVRAPQTKASAVRLLDSGGVHRTPETRAKSRMDSAGSQTDPQEAGYSCFIRSMRCKRPRQCHGPTIYSCYGSPTNRAAGDRSKRPCCVDLSRMRRHARIKISAAGLAGTDRVLLPAGTSLPLPQMRRAFLQPQVRLIENCRGKVVRPAEAWPGTGPGAGRTPEFDRGQWQSAGVAPQDLRISVHRVNAPKIALPAFH